QRTCAASSVWSLQLHHAVDFDVRALRQSRDGDSHARGIRLAEILGHHFIERGEVGEVEDVDGDLGDLREAAARRTGASIGPCTSSAVAGSSGICPEQYTVLPTLTAWE